MKHLLFVLLILFLIASTGFAQQETIRVATYSLLRFDSDDEARVAAFQAVVNGFAAGIIVCQDIITEDGADFFLTEVLNPELFARAAYIDCDGQNDNMCYFRSDIFTCGDPVAIATDLRDVTLYPLSLIDEFNMPVLYVATTYLKGSEGGANEQLRLAEVTEFLNYLDAEGLNDQHVLFGGNFNLYDSDEPAWAALHENGVFRDPIEIPGDWHDREEFAALHTQSTRTEQFGGGSPGGLDDRFDFIFMTSAFDNEDGWMYEVDSYTAFGNDGNHLNQAITNGENQAVPAEVAQALYDASDHLPVFMNISYTPAEDVDFTIRLLEGWNMISSPVQPRPANMESVWAEVVGRDNLRLLKNDRGQFYAPRANFNNMHNWSITRGYQARIDAADELVITGHLAPWDTPIEINEGWSIVPYFPEQLVPAPEAVVSIVNELIIIKDFLGRFYKPEFNFSNMGLLRQSQGYYVKLGADAVLVWNVPEEEIMAVEDLTTENPMHFNAPQPTGRNMSILVSVENWAGLSIQKETELGAFLANGKCVGSTFINGDSPCGIAVWGDDQTTDIIEGAVENEALTFKIWDNLTGCAVDLELSATSIEYRTDGFELLTISGLSIPTTFNLESPYPNPFNSSTSLSFTLPEQLQTTLSILDISGSEVIRLIDSQLSAGSYQRTFNAVNLPSGMYFAKLTAGQQTKTAKIILMR